MRTKFSFYTRSEYFQLLIDNANRLGPGDRIAVATMSFDPAVPQVAAIMEALSGAARRGATVTLAVDARSFLVNESTQFPGPMWYRPNTNGRMWEPFSSRLHSLERLAAAGANFAITNIPHKAFSLAAAGRSHIKAAIINDTVYIGGCNLTTPEHIDVMVGWEDTSTASSMYTTLQQIARSGNTMAVFKGQDRTIDIEKEHVRLLLDSGTAKQSVILAQALQLIDQAKVSIFITCQFFPGGSTAKHLLAAHRRGVKVSIIYSHPSAHGKEAIGHYAQQLMERTRLPGTFFSQRLDRTMPMLHAKVLASEKAAMVGSHNYVSQGVWLGTAEIALHISDPAFAQQLGQQIKTQIKQAH